MRKFGTLAIAVVGISVIAQAIAVVSRSSWLVQAVVDLSDWLSVLATFIGVGLLAGFGYWLIAKRESLASRLFDESELPFAVDALALLRVAIIIIGFILLVRGGPRLMNAASSAITAAVASGTPDYEFIWGLFPWWEIIGSAVTAAMELAIGALLIGRSAQVADRVWALGVPVETAPAQIAACPACGAPFDPAEYRDESSARCVDCGASLYPGSL